MTDRPILFSAPMVQAILREIRAPGTGKTQTRRVLKTQPAPEGYTATTRLVDYYGDGRLGMAMEKPGYSDLILPVGYQPGQRLWVRETWTTGAHLDHVRPRDISPEQSIGYVANENEGPWLGKLRPSIFMPRWASRITLEVTDVRVQRLHEISESDAMTEGAGMYVPGHGFVTNEEVQTDPGLANFISYRMGFESLWDSLNADRAPWASNPWVVAISFKPHLCNIDQMEKAA
ncbi:MAG: hypothetical protein EpisKO_41230 [Epibacterium sp.]